LPQAGTAQVVRDLPKFDDPNLLVGADGFSDAGVYRLAQDLLIVQSLDFFPPLVDDPFIFGQIAAANSLSDIYAMGARPTTALNIVGFPDDKLDLSILSDILRGGADRVKLAGAVIAGGHTVRDAEIKYGLSVTGVVRPDQLITNQNAKPGDALVLTKALGTGFITTALKAGQCSPASLEYAIASMIQLNRSGCEAAHQVGARAATDITGFGLAGHAWELAQSSHVTLVIDVARLPALSGALQLAAQGYKSRANASNREYTLPFMRIEATADAQLQELLFDPQTSGGLLISVPESQADELVSKTRSAGASDACRIGSVIERTDVALIIQ
jgi:selenide,water dikinase